MPRVDQPVVQSETILLVDDNELVRTAIASFLDLKGFHVVQADSGPEAIRIAQNQDFEIHLLVTDVVMPGIILPSKKSSGGDPELQLARFFD